MIDNGASENMYHSGSIYGNHCMKSGEIGSIIIDGIEIEMKKVISSKTNRRYLEALGKCFERYWCATLQCYKCDEICGASKAVFYQEVSKRHYCIDQGP